MVEWRSGRGHQRAVVFTSTLGRQEARWLKVPLPDGNRLAKFLTWIRMLRLNTA